VSGRVVVRIRFKLAHARRLLLVVRGPAPSCDIVGTVRIRGRGGLNLVDFRGLVRGRMLPPGIYVLTLSLPSRLPFLRPALVQVSSPRRTVPLARKTGLPTCSEAAALPPTAGAPGFSAATTAALPATWTTFPVVVLVPAPRKDSRGGTPAETETTPTRLRDHDVLGAGLAPRIERDSGEGGFASAVALALLALIGFATLMLLTLVTRFVRGTWNP
jgi:hypothetical protein